MIFESKYYILVSKCFLVVKLLSYKTTDALMRHLRNNGISISGSKQKKQLINTGYFHGYKGYRFFKKSNNRIPFTDYDEIYATIKYDSDIKSLFYGKLMFIETAVKNVSLERIMIDSNSENIQQMYNKVIAGYNSFPVGTDFETKSKAQKNKLKLEKLIQTYLTKAYEKNNPQIVHFYNNLGYEGVPLWALFEILTLGDFAYLLSCLNFATRKNITSDLGMKVASVDTNRELIYNYLYTLKDLRNAIAHNAVVFDARFRRIEPTSAMRECLKQEFGLPYVNFKTIGDYLVLICYYLKLLNVSKTEIKTLIRDFEKITDSYIASVNPLVANKVVHPDLNSRITILKNSI